MKVFMKIIPDARTKNCDCIGYGYFDCTNVKYMDENNIYKFYADTAKFYKHAISEKWYLPNENELMLSLIERILYEFLEKYHVHNSQFFEIEDIDDVIQDIKDHFK